jgi:hypothetical protein
MPKKRIKYTEESVVLLDTVIARSIEMQAQHDAANTQSPARQDTTYLKVFYGTRRERLGYQKA